MYEQLNGAAINISMELEKFMKHMKYLDAKYMSNDCFGKFISTMWNDLIQKYENFNVIKAKEMIAKELGLNNNINTVWDLIATRVVHDSDMNINARK